MALTRFLITRIFLSISGTCFLALAKLSFGAPYIVAIQTSSGANSPSPLIKKNLKTLLKVITAHAFQCNKNGESLPIAQVRNRQKAYDQTVGDEKWYLVDKKNVNCQGNILVQLPLDDILSNHWGGCPNRLPFNIAMLGSHTLIAVPMSLTVTGQSLIRFDWIAHFMSALDGNAKPA